MGWPDRVFGLLNFAAHPPPRVGREKTRRKTKFKEQAGEKVSQDAVEEVTLDEQVFSELVSEEYGRRWGCDNSVFSEDTKSRLEANDGVGMVFDAESLDLSFAGLKKHNKLDKSGICLDILWYFRIACPAYACEFFSKVASSNDFVSELTVAGHCVGKKRSPVAVAKTRCILPFGSILRVVDMHVGRSLKTFLDKFSEDLEGYEECAKKGRQCMDIAWTCSQVVEKAMDCSSTAAIAQADIKQHYDHVVPFLVWAWLVFHQCCARVSATFLRLQCCPGISIAVASGKVLLNARSVGLFTGSCSAVQAGRVPLIDAASSLGKSWLSSGWHFTCKHDKQRSIGLSSFVDNLYVCSKQADTAVNTLELAEKFLVDRWGLHFGADSRQVMQVKNAPDSFRERDGWTAVESMKVLGQFVSRDGGVGACIENTIRQMWHAFYANLCDGLMAAPEKAKFVFLRSSIMSLASWRWARWPFCKKTADRLDSVQSHFIQILFPVFQKPSDSADKHFSNVRLQAGRLSSKTGRWSQYFAGAVKAWHTHLLNADFEHYWGAQISTFMTASDLHALRLKHARGSRRNSTNTRVEQGHVHIRWHDGHENALGVECRKPGLASKTRFFFS